MGNQFTKWSKFPNLIIHFSNVTLIFNRSQVCSLEFDRKDIKMNKFLATTLEGSLAVFKSKNDGSDFDSISLKVKQLLIFNLLNLVRTLLTSCILAGSQ